MRVLVCGGRDFNDYSAVCTALNDHANMAELLIHGGARGADSLAGAWAAHHDIRCGIFKADWKTYGAAAGPIRNQIMLDVGKPDLVIAFHGGRGTADMVRKARIAGVAVVEIA